MSTPQPYLIAKIGSGKLYAMAMPSADSLTSELNTLALAGINSVVCLQTERESTELGLSDEAITCEARGISFTRFAIEDYGVPEEQSLTAFINFLYGEISTGKQALVHCKGGIGRTGLVCCCLLIKSGLTPEDAIHYVSSKRQLTVPETTEQVAMIDTYADILRRTES